MGSPRRPRLERIHRQPLKTLRRPRQLPPITATHHHRPERHHQRSHAEQHHRAEHHELEPARTRGPRQRLEQAIHGATNQKNAKTRQQPPSERATHRRSDQAQQANTGDASPHPVVPWAVGIKGRHHKHEQPHDNEARPEHAKKRSTTQVLIRITPRHTITVSELTSPNTTPARGDQYPHSITQVRQ